MKKNTTLPKRFLIIFILMLFIISMGIVCYQYFFSSNGNYAYIYQDGDLLYVIDLSNTESPYEITIDYKESKTEGYNIISVENGKIGITDADCPDKTCVHMGMTNSKNFPITCLPHKLIIQVQEDDRQTSNSEIDAISQ